MFVNAIRDNEVGHRVSASLLDALGAASSSLIEPTVLMPEIAAALVRGGVGVDAIAAFVVHLSERPDITLVALDTAESHRAAKVAAEQCLRGSDAVYVAVALRYGSTLVSLDRQQLDRAAAVVRALTPEEALAALSQ
ncbi:MAG: type II toxin-antitoxin system VapC family toxin [Anaerolineae bacterium]